MYRTTILKWCLLLGCVYQARAQRIIIETDYEQKAPVIFTNDNPGKHFYSRFMDNSVIVSDRDNKLGKLDVRSKTMKRYENIEVSPGTVSWTQDGFIYFLEDDRRNKTGKVVSLDVTSAAKKESSSVGENPPFRLNAATWENASFLWMFGGEYIHPETGEFIFLNDFWQLDKKSNRWTLLRTRQTPEPGSRAVTWMYENTLYLYGGYNINPFKDMWKYNLKEAQWEKMEINEKELSPGLRLDAHSWVSDGELWLWGGENFTTDIEPFFWIFNLEKQKWNRVFPNKLINPRDCNSVFYEEGVLYLQMHTEKNNVLIAKIIPLEKK
ncbi:kelch repeat-containing protein [Leadbetterella sp. DM7]|uniref:Kelch repeat-containing protein n=1 Tax=Leadbetterella sp. DM7 TaxID=3235085 RepID=UPI00349EF537